MTEKYMYLKMISNSTCYVSWDSSHHIRNLVEWYFNRSFSKVTKALRLYSAADVGIRGRNEYNQEIIIDGNQSQRIVEGLSNNRSYYAEIGIKLSNHHFFPILRSNIIGSDSLESESGLLRACPEPSELSYPWSKMVSTYTYYVPNNWNGDFSLKYEYKQKVAFEERKFEFSNAGNKSREVDNSRVMINKNEKPRILILSWEYPPHLVGGLSRHVQGLAHCLQKMGYEVHVITSNSNEAADEETNDSVRIHRVTPLNHQDEDFLSWIGGLNLAMLNKALEIDKIHRFNLIHAHDWLVGASAIVLRNSLRIPLIATFHATEYGRNNGIHTELQKFIHEKEQQLITGADTVIVCSEYMRRELKQVFRIPNERNLHIIPNGTSAIKPLKEGLNPLEGFPIQKNKRLIFSIGRIVKEKGFDTIIDAAQKMQRKFPDVYFIVAGKGPLLYEYRMRAERLQLQNQLFFVDYVTDEQKSALFNHCSIAVFPSRYEPFGIVALEAMQAGKPTIVSNTGGLKGIVQHKRSGMLMTPGSSDSLIEQIIYLLENELQAEQIGLLGKKRVESIFSWERMAEETVKVYEELLIHRNNEND
ncbi:glycosyltransferase [Bacillus sp. DTU_2020_1000418_1_SI_GHA_SEK_038]|uniref:glycosyltransferase n=1 Tax=Bacillus sp. DTU_2020_1000418_1_SI_GHA_SEK_038 TaxID=3077585 RepID=UPI0028EFFAF4|nr:glycosyltransferase [Bacillus sp. DTU_2020_1000418_1_SI_GHA_SEK_038]WNS74300.1 glycosyltransferase [Bacillus sp. DTU_2020_1000418_1_SI_GHA_SEK_038]